MSLSKSRFRGQGNKPKVILRPQDTNQARSVKGRLQPASSNVQMPLYIHIHIYTYISRMVREYQRATSTDGDHIESRVGVVDAAAAASRMHVESSNHHFDYHEGYNDPLTVGQKALNAGTTSPRDG